MHLLSATRPRPRFCFHQLWNNNYGDWHWLCKRTVDGLPGSSPRQKTLMSLISCGSFFPFQDRGSSRSDNESDDDDDDSSSEEHSCPPMDVSHLETMNEEIVANARRDFAREERFQTKLLLARQKRMNLN